MSEQPFTEPVEGGVDKLTDAGREYMAELVTDVDGPIYAWTEKADRHTVATQNMRKSRSKNGGRVIVAKEFSGGEDKDLSVAFRVSQEFGDDSVQQLYSVDVDIEGLSQLATKQVEWHRTGIAYLEKSTRYVPYDEKDEQGHYKYVVPETFDAKVTEVYENHMDSIFNYYSQVVDKLTQHVRKVTPQAEDVPNNIHNTTTRGKALDAARVMLPASTRTILGIHGTAQSINNMILRLSASDIPEVVNIGEGVLKEVRKLSPVFFERTAWPHRGGRHIEYYKNLRQELQRTSAELLNPAQPIDMIEGQIVDLRKFTPPDEFELLPYMLFEEAPPGYSLDEIERALAKLSTEQKLEIFQAYIGEPSNRRHRPGRALEQANYSWELVTDFGAFRDLQRHRIVDDLRWQRLHVGHGFDIPQLAEEAGLNAEYRQAMEISQDLFDFLERQGKSVEAQYAVLLGHKLRWIMKTNGRSNHHIFQLRSQPAGHPSYRQTVQKMYEKVEAVHPNFAKLTMPYMNMNEDSELGRLDQELALEQKRKLHRD